MNEDKNNVIPLHRQSDQESSNKTPAVQESKLDVNDLSIAYLVGLDDTGNFIFQIFGKNPNLLHLLGLEYHAARKINEIYNSSQVQGDRLTHEVGKAVQLLHQKIDKLIAQVIPINPDNNL